MIGPPSTLRTVADWDVAHQMALDGKIDRGALIRRYRGLLEHRQSYTFDRVLGPDESSDGEAPEYIVLTDEDGARRQQRLVDDPNSEMARLGLTAADIDARIVDLEID